MGWGWGPLGPPLTCIADQGQCVACCTHSTTTLPSLGWKWPLVLDFPFFFTFFVFFCGTGSRAQPRVEPQEVLLTGYAPGPGYDFLDVAPDDKTQICLSSLWGLEPS